PDDNRDVAEVLLSCPLVRDEAYVDVVLDVKVKSEQREEVVEMLHDCSNVLTESLGMTDLDVSFQVAARNVRN
ncbi:hypothetical protein ACJMK2_011201, partial [Sinanodonta woodiana]